ncbi:Pyridoxamine 5'-phosphate oxidase [Candidatus Nitrosomarinus catalina]|jgi:nitroimidazol reductase NimA-like FMN-containing flavoprotein (pyridoxamine 5'-phosphate oxidase superfamily)|uniref:Pyridoxamine 5'-phosphate oxidase n=1 Tax=Candidatus Nitrosomarinus catalinensis TaxID=1898749 RepID=A0A2Z2HJ31_9ARCH|nr:pyridoxamine 5'-phosphate oxidase family protein [Candidatus Nitrosomarinus catalina]ARS64142.1 Pyridoxamine 5'-phosphate oxidase [Candidatus Nitrosomarinus catalina]
MQLVGILEIKSFEKIKEFLNDEHVGRISSIDVSGFPQIIPMNFVFLNDAIYMHSHVKGEKLDNISNNDKVGFEADRELEFLPSYFEDPHNAALADTLYISVVVKGIASFVTDREEKTLALNGLMEKYQPEGFYDPLKSDMRVLDAVSVIKINPQTLHGKYKIGQHMSSNDRMILAKKILEKNSATAKTTLKIMGFEEIDGVLTMIDEPKW